MWTLLADEQIKKWQRLHMRRFIDSIIYCNENAIELALEYQAKIFVHFSCCYCCCCCFFIVDMDLAVVKNVRMCWNGDVQIKCSVLVNVVIVCTYVCSWVHFYLCCVVLKTSFKSKFTVSVSVHERVCLCFTNFVSVYMAQGVCFIIGCSLNAYVLTFVSKNTNTLNVM